MDRAEDVLTRLVARLGLRTREQRAWAMYDWANSAFQTTIITAIFPIYFTTVAASGLPGALATERFATATTVALTIIAVLSPILGAYADYAGRRKRLLAAFLVLGVVTTALMWFIDDGEWRFAALLFIVSNIAVSGSFVFYDSLLPHVAGPTEVDRVSSAGYGLGYLGGGVLLALNLAWILWPGAFGLADKDVASRLSFVSVAVWWLVFAIPLLLRVPEPPVRARTSGVHASVVGASFAELGRTLGELGRFRHAALMLVAFLIYNDGIGTIIRMAGPYGTEIGLSESVLISAILLVQFVGIPFAFAFGWLADWIGAKRAIFLALVAYTGISILAYHMTEGWQFYLLAFLVGAVQGGSQALSRSLFATLIPRHKSSEFFGFFGVFEKFAGIVGPAIFAVTVRLTGTSRLAILSVIAFFALGAIILAFVNVEQGQREARAAEEEATALSP